MNAAPTLRMCFSCLCGPKAADIQADQNHSMSVCSSAVPSCSALDLQPLHSQTVMAACSAEGLIKAGQPAPLPQAESHMEGIAGPK